jgi:hypothetical protein
MYFDRHLLDAISAARREVADPRRHRVLRRSSRGQNHDPGPFPIRM